MTRRTIEVVAFLAVLLLAAFALHAWLASRKERQILQSTLDAQKKILDAADARESARNANLSGALAEIATLKRTVQTPEQIVHDLSAYLPLPQPINLMTTNTANATIAPAITPGKSPEQGTDMQTIEAARDKDTQKGISRPAPSEAPSSSAANPLPDVPSAAATSLCVPAAECVVQIPAADLKPLDNYIQDCRACQEKLSAAQQNSADDATKIAALTNERDAAVTAAKGGTFWRRLRRNAEWAAVGTAAGFLADHATRH